MLLKYSGEICTKKSVQYHGILKQINISCISDDFETKNVDIIYNYIYNVVYDEKMLWSLLGNTINN